MEWTWTSGSPCLRQPQLLRLVHPILHGVHRVAVKPVEHSARHTGTGERPPRGCRADAAELAGAGRERVAGAQTRHRHRVRHGHLLRVVTTWALVQQSLNNNPNGNGWHAWHTWEALARGGPARGVVTDFFTS